MGRYLTTTKESVITKDDGSTVTTTKQTQVDTQYIPNEEPPYIKLYLKDLLYLKNLPESYIKILMALLQMSTYCNNPEKYGLIDCKLEKGMIMSISIGMKEIVCETLGIKNVRTINNALTSLAKKKVIIRKRKGMYVLNPNLFGIGYWKDIKKLRLNTDYDLLTGEKELHAEITYKDDKVDVTPKLDQIKENEGGEEA